MLKLYTVHDQESKTYIKPFVMLTDRDAIEGFKHVCNDEKTPYYKFPADFNLCSIGSFNEQTGVLEPHSPSVIARAVNLKAHVPTVEEIIDHVQGEE